MNEDQEIPVCGFCHSADVFADAFMRWDASSSTWVLDEVYDERVFCASCDCATRADWIIPEAS